MLAVTLLLLPLIAFAVSAHAEGSFITPPATGAVHDYAGNPLYHVGDTLDIEWDVSWSTVSLWLWQNDNPNAENLLNNVKNTGKLSWQIRTNKDPASLSVQSGTNGTVFFLQISGTGSNKGQFGSHYFNLSEPSTTLSSDSSSSTPAVANLVASSDSSATTTSEPSQTPDTTTVQVTPSAPATAVSSPINGQDASAASASQSSSSAPAATPSTNNTGLAAGLGIAFGLVFAGLVAALVYILMRRRRRNQALAQQHEESVGGMGATGAMGSGMNKTPIAPPIYAGAGGYYTPQNEKGPLPPAPVEIMDERQTQMYGAVARNVSGTGDGKGRVHEMPGAENMARPGSFRQISGVYEMPVHTRGNSTGIFNEEG